MRLADLRVVQGDGWKETPKRDGSPSGHMIRDLRPATVADLIAALKEEGAINYEAAAEVRFLQGEGTEHGWKRNKAELASGPEPDRAVVETMRRHRDYARDVVDAALGIDDEGEK